MLGLGIRSIMPPLRLLGLYEVSRRRSVAFVLFNLPPDPDDWDFSSGILINTFSFSNDFDAGDIFVDVSTSSYSYMPPELMSAL